MIAYWLACWTNDLEIGVRVLLAVSDLIATMGQLALCTLGLGLLNPPSFHGR